MASFNADLLRMQLQCSGVPSAPEPPPTRFHACCLKTVRALMLRRVRGDKSPGAVDCEHGVLATHILPIGEGGSDAPSRALNKARSAVRRLAISRQQAIERGDVPGDPDDEEAAFQWAIEQYCGRPVAFIQRRAPGR